MNRADWSIQKAIEDRVKLEDMVEWAQKPVPKFEYTEKPYKFELTETAKYVFAKGIRFFRGAMP